MQEQTLQLARQLVAQKISGLHGSWSLVDDYVQGPGSLRILVQDHSEEGQAAHIDFGVYFNVGHPEPLIIWDCAGGIGDSDESKVQMAVDVWTTCTAVVLLEWLKGTGELADHSMGDDGLGLKGWHAILGPVWGLGRGSGPDLLQKWVLEHPLLPQMTESLSIALPHDRPSGVKFFFGSSAGQDVAEVRINGVEHLPSSAALAGLKWPRFNDPAFVRCFVFFIHPLHP